MRLRVWFAWFGLAVFVNAVAPKSFLHAFHAHEETCHGVAQQASISSQHEHCDFLRLQLFACEAVSHQVDFTATVVSFKSIVAPISVVVSEVPSDQRLRGPPVC